MPQEKHVNATGTIDGANTTFSVGEAYVPGSLVPYRNGLQWLHRDGNPFTETDPSAGTFDLSRAPEPGDTVSARFIDTSPIAPETEVIEIDALLELEAVLDAEIVIEQALDASLETETQLDASVSIELPIEAVFEEEVALVADVELCL